MEREPNFSGVGGERFSGMGEKETRVYWLRLVHWQAPWAMVYQLHLPTQRQWLRMSLNRFMSMFTRLEEHLSAPIHRVRWMCCRCRVLSGIHRVWPHLTHDMQKAGIAQSDNKTRQHPAEVKAKKRLGAMLEQTQKDDETNERKKTKLLIHSQSSQRLLSPHHVRARAHTIYFYLVRLRVRSAKQGNIAIGAFIA